MADTIKTRVEVDVSQAQQDIVKFNGIVSDSTADIADKIEAKNKAVELQNQLSEKAIQDAEEELKLLEATGAETDKVEKAKKRLNAERLKATKLTVSNENALKKLEQQQEKQNRTSLVAADSIKAMRMRLSDLTKQYDAASKEGRATILPSITELKEELDEAVEASQRFQHNVGNYPDGMGKASIAFGQLDDATGGLGQSFKALIANPVGAVITALIAVFAALKSAVGRSEKATEAFNKVGAVLEGIFNGVIAVLEPVVEWIGDKLVTAFENPKQAIIDLGNVILENILNRFKAVLKLGPAISALFKGDFKKAGKIAADAFIQMSTGVENATDKIAAFAETAKEKYTEAAEATKALANAEKALLLNEKELEKQQLTSLRLAEEQRQIRDDTSKSIEERMAANEKLGEILDAQLKKELEIANQQLDFAEMRAVAEGRTLENIEAIEDAEIKLLEIQERITGQRSEQLTNINALLDEQKAKQEEAAKLAEEEAKRKQEAEELRLEKEKEIKQREFEAQLEIDELDMERRRQKGEDVLNLELELLNRKMENELSNTELLESERNAITARYKAQETALIQKANEAKKTADEEYTKSALASAGEIFGVSKELALAEMLLGLPKVIKNSIESGSKMPFPLNIVAVAANLAAQVPPIIKGIADVKRVKKPKGATSGGGTGGGGATSSGAAAVSKPSITAITDLAANNAARLGQDPSLTQRSTQIASANVTGSTSREVVFSESKKQEFDEQVSFKENKTTF